MESHRLAQLRRQKELILEQLQWINQEIDREQLKSVPSFAPKTSRLLEAVSENKAVAPRLEFSDPETMPRGAVVSDLYEQLGPDTKSAAADTKRGCLLFASLAFGLLAAGIGYVAFFY